MRVEHQPSDGVTAQELLSKIVNQGCYFFDNAAIIEARLSLTYAELDLVRRMRDEPSPLDARRRGEEFTRRMLAL